MAFPVVQTADTKNGVVTSNTTNWTLTYPTNLASGDLILAFVSLDGSSSCSFSSPWVTKAGTGSGANFLSVAAKISDGTETGTFQISNAAEQGAWRIFRITGWYGSGLGTAGTDDGTGLSYAISTAGSPSNTPDPPSLNPANWDVQDTLWLAVCGVDTSRTISVYPLPDLNTADVSGGAGGASLGVCMDDLAQASLDPGTFTISSSDDHVIVTVAVRPAAAGNVTVTPGVASLTATRFTPTVTASDHKIVVPGTKALALTAFTAVVTVGTLVTPGTASLTTTAFAPTVTVTDNKVVTPGTASLALTRFTPTVTATDNQTVVPGVASLTLTRFVPVVTVSDHKIVTPGTASLTLTRFTPTVSAGQSVTPGTAVLTITRFAPVVTVTTNQLVTPGTAALVASRFAPTVTVSNNIVVIPGVASLAITRFAPIVTTNTLVIPGTAALSLTRFAPTVTASQNQTVIPGTANLTLTRFVPVVTATGSSVSGTIAMQLAIGLAATGSETFSGAAAITVPVPAIAAAGQMQIVEGPIAMRLSVFITADGTVSAAAPESRMFNRGYAYTTQDLIDSVNANTRWTGCPLPHFPGTDYHKEPLNAVVPGSPADFDGDRAIRHEKDPAGIYYTTVIGT